MMRASESNDWFTERLVAHPIMAILRGYDTNLAQSLTRRLWDAGVQLVEVPLQRRMDLITVRSLARDSNGGGRWIGAGTITTVAAMHEAIDAGASFLICPGYDETVVRAALARGVPILPGAATPSEVQRIAALGLRWVKVFPAGALGPDWIRAMRGPFPEIKFVATGGIGMNNLPLLADAADAVALGSAIETLLESGDLPTTMR